MEFLFCYGSRVTVAASFYSQELWSLIQNLFPPPILGTLDYTITEELEALMRIG